MKRIYLIFYYFLVISQQEQDFNQNLFDVKLEYVDNLWFDPQYVEDFSVKSYKFNRTVTTVKHNFHPRVTVNEIKATYKIFKFLNQDFKFIGISSSFDACKALKSNFFGAKVFKTSGNYTDCPLKPVSHGFDNIPIDGSKLPPLFPEGKYKVETAMIINDIKTPVAKANVIGSVTYPLMNSRKKN